MKDNKIIQFKKPIKKEAKSKGYSLYNEGLCFYQMDNDSMALKKFLASEAAGYESADMFSSMARIYGAEGKYNEARTYAQKAIEIDKDYGFSYMLVGGTYFEIFDYENALKYYLLAEKYEYDDVIMFRQIAECYRKISENNILKELEYATKAIELDPSDAYSRYWKGWVYYTHNEFKHALKYFLKALDMGYSDMELYFEISYCYSMMKDLKKALEFANKCIFLDKSDYLGYYRKGFAYFMNEDNIHALENFLIAEKKECKEADMYSRIGFIYQLKEDFDKAIKYANKSISLNKFDIDGYILKGNIYAALKHDYHNALKYYKKAYKLNAQFNIEDFYINFAAIYTMLNKYNYALKIADKGLSKFPKSYNLMNMKLTSYIFKQDYKKAEEITKALIDLEPQNPWNDYYIAMMAYNSEKNFYKTIEILEKIDNSEINENGMRIAFLSFSYYEIKDYEKSLEYFRQFCKQPYTANSEVIIKNKSEIKKYYKRLLSKFPNDENLRYFAQKFAQIL